MSERDADAKLERWLGEIADGKQLNLEKDDTDDATRKALRMLQGIRSQFAAKRRNDAGQAEAGAGVHSGQSWCHLRIGQAIGEGGMGHVFEAHDGELNRTVAVKFLSKKSRQYISDRHFIAEAQRLAKVRHNHVLAIYGARSEDDVSGFWCERLQGQTLDAWRPATLTWPECLRLCTQMAQAVKAVHDAQIVHGDIKPQNFMVEPGRGAVLMDFGAGSDLEITLHGQMPYSTPLVMAPELFDGSTHDKASDVYALGVVFYFLSHAGAFPHNGRTLSELKQNIERGVHIHGGLGPHPWRALLRDMLATNPGRRPVIDAVIDALQGLHAAPAKRNKRLMLGTLFALLTVTSLVLLLSNLRIQKSQQATVQALNETAQIGQMMHELLISVSPSQSGRDVLMADVLEGQIAQAFDTQGISDRVKTQALITLITAQFNIGHEADALHEIERLLQVQGMTERQRMRLLMLQMQTVNALRQKDYIERLQALHAQAGARFKRLQNAATPGDVEMAALQAEWAYTEAEIHNALHNLPSARERLKAAREYWLAQRDSPTREGALTKIFIAQANTEIAASNFPAAIAAIEAAQEHALQQMGGKATSGNLLSVRNTLASALTQSGQAQKALPIYEKTLKDSAAVFGVQHPDHTRLMFNYANALNQLGRHESAIDVLQQLQTAMLDEAGGDAEAAIHLHNNLANNLKALKRFDAAEEHYRLALDKAAQMLPPTHPLSLMIEFNLAELLYESGQPQRSLHILEARWPVATTALGEAHIITLEMREARAWVLHLLGNEAAAAAELQAVLQLKQGVYPADSNNLSTTRERIDALNRVRTDPPASPDRSTPQQ